MQVKIHVFGSDNGLGNIARDINRGVSLFSTDTGSANLHPEMQPPVNSSNMLYNNTLGCESNITLRNGRKNA
jgi:hypothetical protein